MDRNKDPWEPARLAVFASPFFGVPMRCTTHGIAHVWPRLIELFFPLWGIRFYSGAPLRQSRLTSKRSMTQQDITDIADPVVNHDHCEIYDVPPGIQDSNSKLSCIALCISAQCYALHPKLLNSLTKSKPVKPICYSYLNPNLRLQCTMHRFTWQWGCCNVPSGKLIVCYWKLPCVVDLHWFTHWKWWFAIVM